MYYHQLEESAAAA